MSFASVLDEYCVSLNCSNKQIAERCGISPSALTRYRKGERVPDADSDVVRSISIGIASIAREVGLGDASSDDAVLRGLRLGLRGNQDAGMGFGKRLDALMKTLGMRNAGLADYLHVDSSYLSRIRSEQRAPRDVARFSETCARYAAIWTLNRGLVDKLSVLIESARDMMQRNPAKIDRQSALTEAIMLWLRGNAVTESDVAELDRLFLRLGVMVGFDAAPEVPAPFRSTFGAHPHARFFYGMDEMRAAELEFLSIALETGVDEVFLSNDMPLLDMTADEGFLNQYDRILWDLVRSGAHISVVHNVERPMRETIVTLEQWVPLYLSGQVTPYYLKGVNNSMFCHVNNVCATCAMASEAVMGHEVDGRYYLTTLPDDLAYYQRKAGFILEASSSLLEIYRSDEPESFARFQSDEARRKDREPGRRIGAGRYGNLDVVLYPGDCAVVTMGHGPVFHFVVRHPKIRYAMSHLP